MPKNPFDQFDSPMADSGNPFDQFDEEDLPPPATPFFWGDVGNALSKRAGNIAQNFNAPSNETVGDSITGSAGRTLRTVGQLAGGINDVIGAGLKSAYRNLTTPEQQQYISQAGADLLQSPPVQAATPLLQAIQEKYGRAKRAFPEGIGNLEAIGNIAGLVPSGWLGGKTLEGASILKGAVTPAITLSNVEKKIDQAIVQRIKKGIKPTIVGKSDAGLVQKFYDSAKTAVRDIVDSSPVPLSKSPDILNDFSVAISNTKKNIQTQFHQRAVDAGEAGALVDIQPVIDDMVAIAIDPNTRRANPNIVNMLTAKVKEWQTLPTMIDPVQAEDLIARLNQEAKAFWKDPAMNTIAATTERIAQQTRKQTFDAVESYTGPGYADLRKRYGAQLALEKEVTDRATQYGRKASYGFFDLANIPAAAHFVESLAYGNVWGALKGGAMLTAKGVMKASNDPSNIIRKMFKDVETLTAIKQKYTQADLARAVMSPDSSWFRKTPGTINAIYEQKLLDIPRRDPTLALPVGQGFEIPGPLPPVTQNIAGKGFIAHPMGLNEGLSSGTISRNQLREMIKKHLIKKGRYIQPGY